MDAVKSQTMSKFIGVNNVDPPERLAPEQENYEYVHKLQQANNVEIDNSYEMKSRSGYTSVKTGSDIHSMWSDGKVWLYVDGTSLIQIDAAYNVQTIRSDLTVGTRMSFTPVNDRIYYTNYYQIGYVGSGADHHLPDPGRNFKEPLPPGQLIEYFMGCLFVARDGDLYISDPLCDYYDTRKHYRRFVKEITMVRSVDDGIYISDDRIWWMPGKGNDEFKRIEVYPSPAIKFTDIRINGKEIDDGISGNVAMWTSENGICLGNNSGVVQNLTEDRYTYSARGQGAAVVREIGNVKHYINSLY